MIKDIRKEIDLAFKRKELFFKPWVGYRYKEGLRMFGSSEPKKVMVIGASRYCEFLMNNSRCSVFQECVNCSEYDRLMNIAGDCPFVNDSGRRGGTHKEFRLFDINSASILRVISSRSGPEAYVNFQRAMSRKEELECPEDIWKHIVFMNYFQPIVWGQDGSRTRTPSFSGNMSSLYISSKAVVEKVISIVKPDLILLWQSSVFKENMDRMFPGFSAYGDGIKVVMRGEKERLYGKYVNASDGRKCILMACPHPTTGRPYHSFVEKASFDFSIFATVSDSVLHDDNHVEYGYSDLDRQWEEFFAFTKEVIDYEFNGR